MNILIIGATSGIGNKLWQHYSSKGNKVAVIARRKEELEKMAQSAPGNTICKACDVADIESFSTAFLNIIEQLKPLDLIIVCAGIGELNPSLDIETELSTVRVNVLGWTNCVDMAYNYFTDQGKGHLVTFTSIGGLQPTPIAPSYSSSKAFQINYTKSLQQKSRKSGIVVTEIRPGLINTRMAKGEGLFWVMPLDKAANAAIKTIERRKKLAIISKRWRVINFLLKHFM
ncbi:MAG: SDR family NAD(P)-dependent oxidoreductase [Bacteroides sp.]|nr:SDR family NAD(P)-dependent oxidoreductase [Bacteroides sp.]